MLCASLGFAAQMEQGEYILKVEMVFIKAEEMAEKERFGEIS